MYARPKRKTIHRDPHHQRTLDGLMRNNGLDLLDRNAVRNTGPVDRDGRLLPERDVRAPMGGLTRMRPKRRLTDAEVAERSHYAALATKYETARAAA